MSRSLMLPFVVGSILIAASTVRQCCAMQEKPFIDKSEIGAIREATKCITDVYIIGSGERYYRKRTQESYCAQLTNGDILSTTRTNKGQKDEFRSIRFGKTDDEVVDLSENSFRVVQRVYLERIGLHFAAQEKTKEEKKG